MNKSIKFGIGVLFLITLYGCGGSGSGSDSPSPTPPPTPASKPPIDPNLTVPFPPAFAHIVQQGFNQPFTISGSIDQSTPAHPMPPTQITGSGQLNLGAGVAATLLGFPVLQATEVITGSTIANGVSTPLLATGTIYYRSDNTTVATNIAGKFFLYLPVAYPATLKAGNTGSLESGTEHNLDGTIVTVCASTVTRAYDVASDSASSLLVTVIGDEKNGCVGDETQTQTVYRIDTAGNVSLVSITAVKFFLGSAFQTLIFMF